MKYTLVFIILLSGLFACRKSSSNKKDQLPPITQTGANTFGCLVNGQVFTPQGFEQNHPAFDMIVDPTFQNGNFGITVFNKKRKMHMDIGSNEINNIGVYPINDFTRLVTVSIYNDMTNCYFGPSMQCILTGPCYVNGNLTLSRYDLSNKIFSGTFEFTLYDPEISCDTFKITQGRFDKKLN